MSTRPHMSFFREERVMPVIGHQEEHKLFPTEGEKLLKLFDKQHFSGIIVVCTMSSHHADRDHQTIPNKITVLSQFVQDVFDEPKDLPPNKPCDHTIPLPELNLSI